MKEASKRVLMIVGATLLIIGSFMTWVSVDVGFAQFSSTGAETTEGKLTILAGAVLMLLVLTLARDGSLGRFSRLLALVAAVFGGVVLLMEYLDVQNRIAEAGDTASATIGTGVWVTSVGAILALAAAGWALMARSRGRVAHVSALGPVDPVDS